MNAGTGDDDVTLGSGDDTFTDAAGDDTITGGAGADTYTTEAADDNDYIIEAVSDSAAVLSGDEVTFDTFAAGFIAANNTIDISAISEGLSGDANPDAVNFNGTTTIANADSFTEVRAALADGTTLVASGTVAGQLEGQFITVTAGDIAGTYLIMNNTNAILDSGDLMFQVDAGDRAQFRNAAAFEV